MSVFSLYRKLIVVRDSIKYIVVQVAFLFLFLCFGAFQINAQNNLRFRHITNDDGLGSNTVNCIIQDKLGFMWFGTSDGLNKYDGYKVYTYRHNRKEENSLISNNIIDLKEDSNGKIWVGTSSGVSLYDPAIDEFVRINISKIPEELFKFEVVEILEDKRGNIWVGLREHGIHCLDFINDTVRTIQINKDYYQGLFSKEIEHIYIDSYENLWIGSKHGLDRFDLKNEKYFHYEVKEILPKGMGSNYVNSFAEDNQGNLLIGLVGGCGLCKLELKNLADPNFMPIPLNFDKSKIGADIFVQSITVDSEKKVWFGVENLGLVELDSDYRAQYVLSNKLSDPYSLNNNSISSICVDNVGDVWVGTYAGGVNVIHFSKQGFLHYKHISGEANSLSYNTVNQFCEDQNGKIWICTDGGGVDRFDKETHSFENFNVNSSNLGSNSVVSIMADSDGDVFVGAWGGGLNIFNPRTGKFKNYNKVNSSLSSDNVFSISQDSKGQIWIGTIWGGLNRFDKQQQRFYNYEKLLQEIDDYDVGAVLVDSHDNVIFGGYKGLHIYNPDTEKVHSIIAGEKENQLSDNVILSLHESNDTCLWIGTAEGLNILNRNTLKVTQIYEEHGLPNNTIKAIVEDTVGNVWISTNNGLCKYDIVEKRYESFTVSDGLQGKLFNQNSGLYTKDGALLFGGQNGFNLFYPQKLKKNTHKPTVVINEFKISNQNITHRTKKSPLKKHISRTKKIELTHKQSFFSIGFVALSFVASEKNKYKYILEGYDKDWNYVETHRVATYTKVEPGEYKFIVFAANNDGVWCDVPAEIELVILPPWWMTLWFRVLLVVSLLISMLSFYRWRIRRLKKEQLLLERKVRERTMELKLANKDLLEKQEEIQQQNEEILAQTEELKKSNNILEEQNGKIERQNEHIKASIRYAQRIQQAILPLKEEMEKAFSHFVVYHPKDVVSGDFYWFAQITKVDEKQQEPFCLVAVVDCTGHGVPGAFMSMIGSRLLNEIVYERGVYDPKVILEKLNVGVRSALRQESTKTDDGMDVCLCRITRQNNDYTKLVFSGAKRPLYYFDSKGQSTERIRGTANTIGGKYYRNYLPFENHELLLTVNDMIYLTSDGYIDQNNPERKKIGNTVFLELLTKTATMPLQEQKEYVEKVLTGHMQTSVQRDDITVLGIRIL